MPKKSAKDLLLELEEQFVTIQKNYSDKRGYLEGHKKNMTLRGQLIAEKEKNSRKPQKGSRKAEAARNSGSTRAKTN